MNTKQLLVAFWACIFLFSCKKGATPPPANGIAATINGKAYTFNAVGTVRVVFRKTTLFITGAQTTGDSAATIVINVAKGDTITPGRYIGYAPGGSEQTSIGFAIGGYLGLDYGSYGDPTDNTLITITSITASNIQGTFSGMLPLRYAAGTEPDSAKLTNGTFNVPIQ